METRANHVWVGVVTLALVALVVAFTIWIARLNKGEQNHYDIFFHQSVEGLAKGSEVSYAGVPAGQVAKIELWKNDPGLVRVNVAIDEKIPILEGTTATIQGSFTGVSTIQLNGGVKGRPEISAPGRAGDPEIPTKVGGLGALLSNAPMLLEHLTTLTDRLTLVLSDKNVHSITDILSHTDKLTGNIAEASPQFKKTVTDLDATISQAKDTLGEFQKVAGTLNGQLDANGNGLMQRLGTTLKSAQAAADALKGTLDDARPAARRLSETTLPQAEAAMRDLRATTKALRDLTEKVDDQGAGAVIGAPKLPVYKP